MSDEFNIKRNIFFTIVGKSLILLLNFGVVIYTTQFWGASGRGSIAIFLANLNLIIIGTNILTSSSVSYFLNKTGASKLYFQAYFWTFLISTTGAFVFHLIGKTNLSLFLFTASLLSGFLSFHSALFIGAQKINYYNLVTALQPLLLLVFMVIFHWTIEPSFVAYFYGQTISLLLAVILARFLSRKAIGKMSIEWDKSIFKTNFLFGLKVELSNLFQFFNYRLGFYFLGYFAGDFSVGVFSIGVTLSESIWIISKSISMVQYSNLVKGKNTEKAWKETLSVSKYSLYFSLVCVFVVLLLPKQFFVFIFGSEFSEVKSILLLLSPGVLAISVSNVYGHYFSAFGKLKILIAKSIVGVIFTIVLSFLFIPSLQITGACIVSSGAHLASSIVLFWYFFRKTPIDEYKN